MTNCDSVIQPYALGTATPELELFRQRQKAKELHATYGTKISEINFNLLPNTCNFHRMFRFIFSLHLSENAKNVHFGEAKFQNFPGKHAPVSPSVLAPSALHTSFARLTLKCFRRACYFQSVILRIILRILRTQKDVSFLSRKGCTFRIIQRCIFY